MRVAFIAILFFSVMSPSAQSGEVRKKGIQEAVQAVPPKEALERMARSVERLKKEGVPVAEKLPVIEDSKQAVIRTKEAIAKRAIALCIVAVKGLGEKQERVVSLVKRYGAGDFFSPQEAAFIKDADPSQEDLDQFGWRSECYWVLLWALGYVDELERPEGECNVEKAISFLNKRTTDEFINGAKLRDIGAILDQADLIYRYHWAIVEARVNTKVPVKGVNEGVVPERHYVLNWLIGYMGQEWDDITTDT